MTAVVSAAAEAQYNQDKVARVAPRTTGMMWRVDRSVGQTVKKGDLLALVDAADVGKAKAELLQANAQVHVRRKTLDRIKASATSGFRTEAELQEADATLRESTIRLLNAKQAMINLGLPVTDDQLARTDEKSLVFLGLPEPVAKTLDPATTTANLIPILAPLDGVIVTRDAVAGEMVDPAKPVFVIADTTTMWVMADLPHEDAKRLSIGQKVTFRPGDESDEPATGTLARISSALDERTRTLRVRAQVANPGLRLVAHTFGKATIAIRATEKAVAVPNEAIQWEGCCHVIFVRLTDDIFQPRKVKLGVKHNGFTEILIGLVPGEIVATTGSHIMKSELFKGNLGTGCAGE
jgi:cobalt-zinc-cadmium efflux system membrane fusion protein